MPLGFKYVSEARNRYSVAPNIFNWPKLCLLGSKYVNKAKKMYAVAPNIFLTNQRCAFRASNFCQGRKHIFSGSSHFLISQNHTFKGSTIFHTETIYPVAHWINSNLFLRPKRCIQCLPTFFWRNYALWGSNIFLRPKRCILLLTTLLYWPKVCFLGFKYFSKTKMMFPVAPNIFELAENRPFGHQKHF